MKEGRKPEYQGKTPGNELQKMPHTKGGRFKSKWDLNRHWWQTWKADVLSVTPKHWMQLTDYSDCQAVWMWLSGSVDVIVRQCGCVCWCWLPAWMWQGAESEIVWTLYDVSPYPLMWVFVMLLPSHSGSCVCVCVCFSELFSCLPVCFYWGYNV